MKVEIADDLFNEDNFKLTGQYKFEKCGGSWSNTIPEEEIKDVPHSFIERVAGFLPPSDGFYEDGIYLWRVVRAGGSEFTAHKFESVKKTYRVSVLIEDSVTVEAESEEEAKEIVSSYSDSEIVDDLNLEGIKVTDVELEGGGEIMEEIQHEAWRKEREEERGEDF
tara:strand:+ start:712 stop:1209 length:498 start_codon:yes stop_codon:yes gene_type:complete